MKKIIQFILLFGMMVACKTPEKVIEESNDPQLLIKMERTACFGKCPIDETILSSDGELLYKGIKDGILQGSFKSNTSKGDYFQELYDTYFSMDYQDVYDDPYISDMPSTIFSFYKDEVLIKKVVVRVDGPSELKELETKIVELIKQSSGWINTNNPRMQYQKN